VLGEYNVPVKLHREVTASVKVLVEPDEESKAKIRAAAEARAKAAAEAPPAPAEETPAAPAEASTADAEPEKE
jgi:hypothetical protein